MILSRGVDGIPPTTSPRFKTSQRTVVTVPAGDVFTALFTKHSSPETKPGVRLLAEVWQRFPRLVAHLPTRVFGNEAMIVPSQPVRVTVPVRILIAAVNNDANCEFAASRSTAMILAKDFKALMRDPFCRSILNTQVRIGSSAWIGVCEVPQVTSVFCRHFPRPATSGSVRFRQLPLSPGSADDTCETEAARQRVMKATKNDIFLQVWRDAVQATIRGYCY